jgi:hypothetical protein
MRRRSRATLFLAGNEKRSLPLHRHAMTVGASLRSYSTTVWPGRERIGRTIPSRAIERAAFLPQPGTKWGLTPAPSNLAACRKLCSSRVHLDFSRVRATGKVFGVPIASSQMKRPLLFALVATALLGTGSALAFMNNACKTGQHPWCAPVPISRQAVKISPS